ncbi:hypothetical protein [Aeromonas sp. FDAARGOS 1404]|uniref:hypothetical protein n=1 Tax=Aeromonas TaxID=642 RepID=UPI001C248F46|nr:hypothetical protein [Aeromonas sp. FDAARGOS 1404]QWZ84818.1 hypothetical protein I6L34_18945 [Aeromonas sp. FDAARGOS 1404]
MTIMSTLKSMDQKFSWSFFGFILAIVFGLLSIYLGFYKNNTPNISYVITTNSSVLDIKEEVGNLDVLYQGGSLSKEKKDLRIITFKVINTGDSAVIPSLYDPTDPLGFNIINGDVAEKPSLVSASNKYLEDKLLITQTKNSILFSNVILESNEYFEIKVLVLHPVGTTPEIQSIGKIAGVRTINVVSGENPVDERSFFSSTFGGGLLKNIIRTTTYGTIFILLLGAMIALASSLDELKDKSRRKALVKTFKEFDGEKLAESDDYFFDLYINGHRSSLKYAYETIKKPNKKIHIDYFISSETKGKSIVEIEQDIKTELINRGFLRQENENLIALDERLLVIEAFINFLRRKNEYKDSLYKFKQELMVNKALAQNTDD